jgi:hypothetical protein
MPFSGPRRAPLAVALCLGALAPAPALPSTASAQGFTCEASALAATVGPAPRIEPVTANTNQSTCRAASAGGSAPASPLPLSGSLLSATTDLQPPSGSPAAQTASAAAGLGELRVAGLPVPIPPPDLGALPGPQTIPGVGTIDVRAVVQSLLPTFTGDLVNLRALRAEASARCVSGAPQLTGRSSVAGITVLGTELPVDRITSRTIDVVDSTSIDPSTLSPAQLGVPGADLAVLQPILDALPTISVPAAAARVRVEPGRRTTAGGRLIQHALDVEITLGGQNVLDLTVGEAIVGAANVDCGGVADLALQCTARRIVLIDVVRSKGKVRLLGAASRRFAGRRVKIRFTATGKVVARPRVRTSGLFRATAPLPRRKLRATNRARYRAEIAKQKSLRLKLVRRMLVQRTSVRGSRVTIAGRIVRPLASPVRTVVVKRRLSCGRYRVVKRFKPGADGRFRITVGGPRNDQAAVYRLQTRVRKFVTNPKTFPTFTLPRYVDLAQ